jgi:dipeptidyl-peptidase 4
MRTLTSLAGLLLALPALSQYRLLASPVWQSFQDDRTAWNGAVRTAEPRARWTELGKLVWRDGEGWLEWDPATGKDSRLAGEPPAPERVPSTDPNAQRQRPARGGQYTEAYTRDGKSRAFHRDWNLWLSEDGGEATPVTTDGSAVRRVKFGSGSWVYGEELGQNEAMGFSPDGRWLWYYRFDESPVVDSYHLLRQASQVPVLVSQAYPKPGQQNPVVDLLVFDRRTRRSVTVLARPGAFDDGVGHYLYDAQWSPSGEELFFRRTDRRQKTMEFCAADPVTGAVRVVTSESHLDSWAENALDFVALDPLLGERPPKELSGKAIWAHERNGFVNYDLLDLKTGARTPITVNAFDAARIVRVDVERRRLFYMAAGPENPYMTQLHVVGLDGQGDRRLTDPALNHTVTLSPDGAWFVDRAEALDRPPVTRLVDSDGKVVRELADSDASGLAAAGFVAPERFTFTAADGRTLLYGSLHKPRNFDPARKYPLLLDVYGGPTGTAGGGHSERWGAFENFTGMGFLVVSIGSRGSGLRGKAFRDALYMKLGQPEIDDQAAGVRHLLKRAYVDASRVAVNGSSYGGYATLMLLLRYPEVFRAGSASAVVSDWRNYDTIYTERYMGLLGENQAGYDSGSAVRLAADLKGWLLLYYGTADDNTHPNNAFQMLDALRRAGKGVEVQVGVDAGHSGVDWRRMAEFLYDRLDLWPATPSSVQ